MAADTFWAAAATTLAAAQFGIMGTAKANEGESRQLAALGRSTGWLNSPPLSAAGLSGKVVLVQFGTYTCINWLRTLPYVRAWARRYRQQLTVIGVHTPEFAFEKNLDNVRRAVQQLKIDHPIAVDSDYAIWRAFNNRYWPALYFIDARGRLRDHHFGEGRYEPSEQTIRKLLAETGVTGDDQDVAPAAASGFEVQADWQNLKSPETYLGYGRAENFSSPGGAALRQRRVYAAPGRLRLNDWALAGEWTVADEPAILNKATRPNRVPISRTRRPPGDGTAAPGHAGTLPRIDGRPASRSCSRFGRGRQRQRHRRRTAAVPANQAAGTGR